MSLRMNILMIFILIFSTSTSLYAIENINDDIEYENEIVVSKISDSLNDSESSSGRELIVESFLNFKNDFKIDSSSNALKVQKVLSFIFSHAINRLEKEGYHVVANEIKNEWVEVSHDYFSNSLSLLELGDHEPLSVWLDKTYKKIEKILGKRICSMEHLTDIKAINYGYPVVFHPKGDVTTNLPWGEVEYNKHFIPFTTAITYWTAKMTCSVSLNFIGSLVCSVALEIPRFGVKHYFAPPLGRRIYRKFNN